MRNNPYTPPADSEQLIKTQAESAIVHAPSDATRRFRYRLIPATLCLLFGIPLICMSAFWGYEIWNTTIASDHDSAFRAVPPVIFCGTAMSGFSLVVAFRWWMHGRWRGAVAATIGGWLFISLAMQISFHLVPEAR